MKPLCEFARSPACGIQCSLPQRLRQHFKRRKQLAKVVSALHTWQQQQHNESAATGSRGMVVCL